MFLEAYQAVILAGVTGLVSAVATVSVLKSDILWLKKTVDKAHARIDKIEDRLHVMRCTVDQ